ncbi:hypothetical protein JX266_011332 [Neoarthrinium moseri]|nr:hypothetical protein JX266_011332 [Neoarthrinium moseri]
MATNPPKPIRVWLTPPGPNSWKVIFLLEELGLNYEIKSFSFENVKKKPFTDINPNGRVPAIEDPYTDLTLWESGAIYQYLIETYDTKRQLSHDALKERHLESQWLHFQMSGQGPYYGHVLEGVLAAKDADKQWLVGDKMTYADMAFVPWNFRLAEVLNQSWDEVWECAPRVRAWHEGMVGLPSWKRSMEIRARLMDEQGLQWNGVPKRVETFDQYEKDIAARAAAGEKK